MSVCRFAIYLLVCSLWLGVPASLLIAQEDQPIGTGTISSTVQRTLQAQQVRMRQDSNQQPQGTLPPVDVTPPTLPPVDVTPSTTDAPDRSFSFPDLMDLEFGQSGPFGDNSGVFRSSKSLFDVPGAASITTRQEIFEKQAPDMFRALENEVGVLMQRTAAGQASPFVRGLTGQQVLILIDGIRLNNSFFRRGPNQYFNTIDPGMVDHIEVSRGQGSVLWGSDAIGGAINVVTRGADVHWGMFHDDYRGGEFTQYFNTSNSASYSRLNVEGWVGQTGFFGGGSFMSVRDLDTGFDALSRQPGTNYQQYAGDIKLNYLIDENQMLTFSYSHFEQEDVPRSDRFPGFPGDLNSSNSLGGARFFDPQQRDLAYVRYQALEPIAAIDALTVTGSYHRQREVQTRGIPTSRFQETDVETVGVNIVAAKELELGGKLTFGGDWYYDDIDSRFGGSATSPIVPDDAYYQRAGAYLNWDVDLTERLNAVAGVRFEHIDATGTPLVGGSPVFIRPSYQDWIGQAGLVYEINPCLHVVTSISEGFRAPNLDDLMANNPNVLQAGMSLPSLGLRPEHSINYEVGLKTNFDRLRTQTFVFWTDLEDNMVSITAAPDTFATANQDSFLQGVEFNGELLLDGGWSLYGNFWYTYGVNLITDSPLSRIPPTQGIAGLRWRDTEAKSYFAIYAWMVRHQDRLEIVRDVTDERIPPGGTPGYTTLNLRCGHTFGCCDQHRVSLSLENITDKAYIVHGSGVLGTGFTARFGYTWIY